MEDVLAQALAEVNKVIVGKEDRVGRVVMAMLAGGHVLLDDVPGVGKTTLASTIGKVFGLDYARVQFTPDVMPSDINGFSLYNRATESFEYMPGVITQANLLLCDEINRTSSKTQSALLEAMEERQVTVDGVTHPLKDPFIVIATQNNVGAAGTQLLPHAQLDRFAVRLTLGYPDFASQKAIIRDRRRSDPADDARCVMGREDVLRMQGAVREVEMVDSIIEYVTALAFATRETDLLDLGLSPRGAIVLANVARACAYLDGRAYTVPEDVAGVFVDVCAHRIVTSRKARAQGLSEAAILEQVLQGVPVPDAR